MPNRWAVPRSDAAAPPAHATAPFTITARTVTSGPAMWAPNPTSQSIVVPPSTVAVTATVNYVTAIGSLAVTVNGLPLGVSAAVTVSRMRS